MATGSSHSWNGLPTNGTHVRPLLSGENRGYSSLVMFIFLQHNADIRLWKVPLYFWKFGFDVYVRSCLYHFISLLLWEQNMACEKENELALARVKMRLVRQMCGVYQLDRYSSVALRDMLGLEENIFSMLQQNRL